VWFSYLGAIPSEKQVAYINAEEPFIKKGPFENTQILHWPHTSI
jgi:hypothetical protein